MTKLYENIQFLRNAKKIKSIRKLETLAGITQDTIKTWKNRLPNCEPVIKIAGFFEVSVDYLLGLTSIPNIKNCCNNPNIGKILYTAETLHLDENATETIIKMMYALEKKNAN